LLVQPDVIDSRSNLELQLLLQDGVLLNADNVLAFEIQQVEVAGFELDQTCGSVLDDGPLYTRNGGFTSIVILECNQGGLLLGKIRIQLEWSGADRLGRRIDLP
jgi:hypothetical protein